MVTALVTGSGRCGTHSVARFLDGLRRSDGGRIESRHESDYGAIVRDLQNRRDDLVEARLAGFRHDVEVNPTFLLMRDRPLSGPAAAVPLAGIVRDGRLTVRSGMTNGWYWNPQAHVHAWPTLLPEFPGDRFARCCQFWAWACRRLLSWGATIVTVEDLATEPAARARLLAVLDAVDDGREFPRANRTTYGDGEVAPAPAHGGGEPWPAACPPHQEWSARDRATFEEHCGELMDRFYPSWRMATGRPGPGGSGDWRQTA